MNKYINTLLGTGLGLVCLISSSCLMTGKKCLERVEIDGKTAKVILNQNNGETYVLIDSLMLREENGDYNLEEVLRYPSLEPLPQGESADSLFERIMKKSRLDSLRKKI